MPIGTYIKLILKKKNISQQELANKTGLTKQKVSNLLNGITPISPAMARRIEIALNLPKYSLVEIVGFPETEIEKRKLEEIDK